MPPLTILRLLVKAKVNVASELPTWVLSELTVTAIEAPVRVLQSPEQSVS